MKGLTFFRRRYIFLPTISGMLVIIGVLGITLFLFVQNVATFLAVHEPVGSNYLVVEGWLYKAELDQALTTFNAENYQYVIVTGGPTDDEFDKKGLTYAERAARYLQSTGFPTEKIIIVSSPYSAKDRTFLTAVMVREWLSSESIEPVSIDVFSSGVHARRSRVLYQLAFGEEVRVGIFASIPEHYDLGQWWESSEGANKILKEIVGLTAIKCCFKPGDKGSHFEKWGIEKNH